MAGAWLTTQICAVFVGVMLSSTDQLSVLFVDMDAFFAAVEQLDHRELRGRPVGVTPVMAESGCCIATSYEARAVGVRTGCRVREARRVCPSIRIVKARPDRYIAVHHRLLDAIDSAIPVSEVESIDECWCHLMTNERNEATIRTIGEGIKGAIAGGIGPLSCSIGVGPNRLIAKVAAAMHKPDGFTVISRGSLPGPLLGLSPTDLPGISKGINRRLRAAGIHDMTDLYACSRRRLRDAWGSVLGEYWWHWLRGDQLPGPKGHRRTVGHQHVLAPEFRARGRARGVSLRLLSKAAQRMRSLRCVATRLSLSIRPLQDQAWSDWTPVPRTDDTVELNRALHGLWRAAPVCDVLQVGVRLEGLVPIESQLPLFEQERGRRSLMSAIDEINRRSGADAIYLAAMHGERKTAPRRIPFGAPPDLSLPDQDGATW